MLPHLNTPLGGLDTHEMIYQSWHINFFALIYFAAHTLYIAFGHEIIFLETLSEM